ncbi:MAG: DNA-binding protein WhiA [Bacilli bacterium]|nr:DNA-binding protein WhiA [Bacilli bacterium]
MSFTTNIKNEISKIEGENKNNLYELSAFIRNNGYFDNNIIELNTENATVAKRIYSLIKEIFDIKIEILQRKNNSFSKNSFYVIKIEDLVLDILKKALVVDDNNKKIERPLLVVSSNEDAIRSYLSGVFLSKGSVNDPKTSRYHLEFLIEELEEANYVSDLLNYFDLNSKVLNRDKGYMVYVKEAEKIGDFLRIINASNGVMYFEDIRIYRDHKNMTNRLNNCEQANIERIIETANKQIEDINYVKENLGIDILDSKVLEVVEYRIKYPDASLQELSDIIAFETGKEISKSGLNHRFRKLRELVRKAIELENK